MGIEISHDEVVITDVKKKVKVRCEIGGQLDTGGGVNIMNFDRDIVDGGCNGEVFSDVFGGGK